MKEGGRTDCVTPLLEILGKAKTTDGHWGPQGRSTVRTTLPAKATRGNFTLMVMFFIKAGLAASSYTEDKIH